MGFHNILTLLEKGLCVTVNADDPSYFGGYLNDNYLALEKHLNLTEIQLLQLIRNSFNASFLPENEKHYWLDKLESLTSS